MEISQFRWTSDAGWEVPPVPPVPPIPSVSLGSPRLANLVLAFADAAYFRKSDCYEDLRRMFPSAHILGCSASGVSDDEGNDDGGEIVVTAVTFAKGRVQLVSEEVPPGKDLQALVSDLMRELKGTRLRHAMVLADGLSIDGSDLAADPDSIRFPVAGGLAEGGSRSAGTWVMADGPAAQNVVALIGYFGELEASSGSVRERLGLTAAVTGFYSYDELVTVSNEFTSRRRSPTTTAMA